MLRLWWPPVVWPVVPIGMPVLVLASLSPAARAGEQAQTVVVESTAIDAAWGNALSLRGSDLTAKGLSTSDVVSLLPGVDAARMAVYPVCRRFTGWRTTACVPSSMGCRWPLHARCT